MTKIIGKRIFITGGAGFIGSTFAKRIVEDNQITLFDNLNRNALKNSGIHNHPNITLIEGDIINEQDIVSAIEEAQPHIIIHCAAIAGIDTVIKDPVNTLTVNIDGSHNVLKGALKVKELDRVILFSTSEVFGSQSFMSNENRPAVIGAVGEARWTYALSKLATEHYAFAYHSKHRLPTVILRPFNIYGPGQVGEGALSIFIQRAIKNEPITIHGDGSQIRAWCFIDDMVKAMFVSAVHPDAVGRSFNIGNNRSALTIYGLANTVVRVLGSRSEINFVPKTHADIELRIPDTRLASEVLDFTAAVDLEEGIPRTAEAYAKLLLPETAYAT